MSDHHDDHEQQNEYDYLLKWLPKHVSGYDAIHDGHDNQQQKPELPRIMSSESDASRHPSLVGRPRTAHGTFLRILTINDVYKLETYPHFTAAVRIAKAACALAAQNCVAVSFLNGDFLSPSVLTALDGGEALMKGVNLAEIDYLMLGNHEMDLGFDGLDKQLQQLNPNITLINSNIDNDFMSSFPEYRILNIGGEGDEEQRRTAVIGAFLTDQMDIYPPNAKPQIRPVDTTMLEIWEQAKASLNRNNNNHNATTSTPPFVPDLFLPMTHQLMHQDRTTATFLSQQEELKARTPVILGGHDHEVYVEEVGNSIIVKVGLDVESIGIIDIWWTANGQMKKQISLVPHDEFVPYDPVGMEYAQVTNARVQEIMATPLAFLPTSGGSTKKVRFTESTIATWLLSTLKRGLNTQFKQQQQQGDNATTNWRDIDLAMIQAGAVRGKADYYVSQQQQQQQQQQQKDFLPPPIFQIGDLYNEFAFETPIGIVDVPGWVLKESVQNTRAAPKPAPEFLHLDADCQVANNNNNNGGEAELILVNGAPLVSNQMYRVATWNHTVNGVNNIQPFLSYIQNHSASMITPQLHPVYHAKEIVLKVLLLDAWRHLFGLIQPPDSSSPDTANASDAGTTTGTCSSCITKEQVKEAVDKTFTAIQELQRQGRVEVEVNVDTLCRYLDTSLGQHEVYHGCNIVREMMKLIDIGQQNGKKLLTQDTILEQLHLHTCND